MAYYRRDEDDSKDLFAPNPLKNPIVGLMGIVMIAGLTAIGAYSSLRNTRVESAAKARQEKREYSSLTNFVKVTAQKGDSVYKLMMKYSGCRATPENIYIWQMDNDMHPTAEISFGKKYIFRTTNTVERVQ